MPWAPRDDVAGVIADQLMVRVCEAREKLHRRKIPFVFERPLSAWGWKLSPVEDLAAKPDVFCGAPYQKPTLLLTNWEPLKHLGCRCCCTKPHQERRVGSLTSAAAAYTWEFAEAVSALLSGVSALRVGSHGGLLGAKALIGSTSR